jgi:hypothetical protein
MRNKFLPIVLSFLVSHSFSQAQSISPTPDQIKAITPEWKGERSADGRPKVLDKFLLRLKNVSMEEAWGTCETGYQTNTRMIGW